MLLCYSGADLCVFQVWRTRSACPSSACYCAIVGLACVYFRCGGQGAPVPAAHVTQQATGAGHGRQSGDGHIQSLQRWWPQGGPHGPPADAPRLSPNVTGQCRCHHFDPLSQDGAEIKYTHMHTFTTLLLSVRMVLRLSIHTFARPVCLLWMGPNCDAVQT